jgi:hypothetical protein
MEKQPPQKALCLGPDPPPIDFNEIYRNLSIFHVFRAFNRAGKTVTKVGIYSKPPPKSGQKVNFIENGRNLSIFLIYRDAIDQENNSRPNFTPHHFFKKYIMIPN